MKKIKLPKWAVVNGLGNARMIHIGNGEFVSADAQTPKVFESCVPDDQTASAPTGVAASESDLLATWVLGQFPVTTEEPLPPATESPADALNAEANPTTTTEPEAAPVTQQ